MLQNISQYLLPISILEEKTIGQFFQYNYFVTHRQQFFISQQNLTSNNYFFFNVINTYITGENNRAIFSGNFTYQGLVNHSSLLILLACSRSSINS